MEPSFYIGDIPIKGEVFLSPMANISDSPYRLLCRRMGAGYSFTEFVSTDGLWRGNQKTIDMFRFKEAERPIIFQIFGNKPDVILEAAKIAQEMGPDVIDLNMGCSCSKVAHHGSGAGLLKDPIRSGRILESMAKALEIPVTAKIRLGWDHKSLNYKETARILEDSGARMISVHGRTKAQSYKGFANWDAIGEVKQCVSVPVMGNGDVTTYAEALERKRDYGVDGVLVGRGGIGNPWLFGGRRREDVTPVEIVDVALEHLDAMLGFYERGLILFRKHASRYFTDFPGAVELRAKLVRTESVNEFRELCLATREKFAAQAA